ncbi:MAG: hypothetical protein AAFV53_26555 [Myxococcota bacterium]
MLTLTLTILLSGLASAQEADAPPTKDAAEGAAEAVGLPAYVWTARAVDLVRWQGTDGNSATVDAGKRVEVLLEDADTGLVRVRNGTEFGWVPRDALSIEEPAQ